MNRTNENKEIGLTFYTSKSLRDWSTGRKILSVLIGYDQDLASEFVELDHGLQRIKVCDYDDLSYSWTNSLVFILHRKSTYRSQTSISLVKNKSGYHLFSMWIEADYFQNKFNVERFKAFGKKLYETIEPDYGFIHEIESSLEMATIVDPVYGKTIIPVNLAKGIPGIYWGNFFSEKFSESINIEKIKMIQGVLVEKLSPNGVFIQIGNSLVEPDKEFYTISQLVSNYFGNLLA
ncbi:MAG: hypothetical protein GYA34_12605 [Chloroflexi bacterium]|nr:hypothetical protein [Chloroflexota bacterium]